MLGRLGRIDQVFYSNGQEFVPLQPLTLDQRMQEYNFYVQDDWRAPAEPHGQRGTPLRVEHGALRCGGRAGRSRPAARWQPGAGHPARRAWHRQSWFNRDNNNFAIGWRRVGSDRQRADVVRGYRLAYQRLISWALNVVEQRQPRRR